MQEFINDIKIGDNIDYLGQLPNDCVDVIFTDPPFNLKKGYEKYKDNVSDAEYMEWCTKWIKELIRVAKPNASIFIHNIPKWCIAYAKVLEEGCEFKHWIAWDAPTSPMGKSLQPNHYGILYYVKSPATDYKFYEIRQLHKRCRKPKCNHLLKDYGGKKDGIHRIGPLVGDVWTDIFRVKHKKYKDDHPCQLPIHLLERIILMSSDEGDIILDPFMGSGTTAVAAKRLGRNYVGFELSEKYVTAAKAKLEGQELSKVGDAWVSMFNDRLVTVRNKDIDEILKYYDVPVIIEQLDYTSIRRKK